MRLAQLDEQIQQRVIAVAQLEQGVVHRAPILAPVLLDPAAAVNRALAGESGFKFPFRERLAQFVFEEQIASDALCGEEEPLLNNAAALDGAQRAAQRLVFGLALFIEAAELDPGIAQTIIVFAAQQKVPLHPLGRVPVRFHPLRHNLAVEEKRKVQGQHARLAGPVVPAQQQPAVLIPELLPIEPVKIQQPAPDRLPAVADRLRQRRCSWDSWLVHGQKSAGCWAAGSSGNRASA